MTDDTLDPEDLEDDAGGMADEELIRLVFEELDNARMQELVTARISQLRIAEANARIERSWIEGIGEMTLSVDPVVYHFWHHQQPGCWQDKGFRREIARDNPEVRVSKARARSTTILVGEKYGPVRGGDAFAAGAGGACGHARAVTALREMNKGNGGTPASSLRYGCGAASPCGLNSQGRGEAV